MAKAHPSTSILWTQVWGLAAMQGAITLMWVIYNLYLVELLTQFGFPRPLATGLLVIENLLAMVMEPLMGAFSDGLQHRVGTRFPFISLGVVLTAGCFLAIPIISFGGQAPLLRWLLPLMMVAWALAMTVFRSPAMSLLGRYAFRTQLPQAASILTLVSGVAGASGPLANQFILNLGPMVAFGIGSAVLLLSTLALSRFSPNATVTSPNATGPSSVKPEAGESSKKQPLAWQNLGFIFGAGVGISLGFRLVMTTYPAILKANVSGIAPPLVMGLVFIALALTALPAGWVATRFGNRRTMIFGLALLVFVTIGMMTVANGVSSLVVAVLLGGALSLVLNGTLPFALNLVPRDKAGLGTGLYFSGGALATSLFGGLLQGLGLPPQGTLVLAALAFLFAGCCVGWAGRRHTHG
jgi:MFS family permease